MLRAYPVACQSGVRPSSGAAIIHGFGTLLRPGTGALRCDLPKLVSNPIGGVGSKVAGFGVALQSVALCSLRSVEAAADGSLWLTPSWITDLQRGREDLLRPALFEFLPCVNAPGRPV